VDQQCHLEIFCHSTKVVIKASEMARHIGLIQCGHLTQAWKENVVSDALSRKHQFKVVYVGET